MAKTKNTAKIKILDLESNIFTEIARGIRLGLTNLWRNRLLSLATITVMAIMICIFNTILAVNFISRQALSQLNAKVDLVFYLKEGTDYYNANQIVSQLSNLPGVTRVDYVSKERAMDLISNTYPETTQFFTKFNLQNPLPASISVKTDNAETHRSITNFLHQSPLNQFIDQETAPNRTDSTAVLSATTQNLLNINHFVRQLVFWIVFIFIIGGALIIINAIQLTIFTRRQEIFIMRLVGATPNFIRLPFITEGICYAVIAVTLSFIILIVGGQALGLDNLQFMQNLSGTQIIQIFLTELGLAALLGLISSAITMENYLRQQLTFN